MKEATIICDTNKLQELIVKRNEDGSFNICYKKKPEDVIRYCGKFEYKETIEDEFEVTQCDVESIKIKVKIEE